MQSPDARARYRAIHALGCCVMCGQSPVTVAHRNQGRGMGQKAPWQETAALCWACQWRIDNGPDLDQRQRRALMDEAIARTDKALDSLTP